jgi:hypothetical protein
VLLPAPCIPTYLLQFGPPFLVFVVVFFWLSNDPLLKYFPLWFLISWAFHYIMADITYAEVRVGSSTSKPRGDSEIGVCSECVSERKERLQALEVQKIITDN